MIENNRALCYYEGIISIVESNVYEPVEDVCIEKVKRLLYHFQDKSCKILQYLNAINLICIVE